MIKGIQKTSLLDYPGKIACTVFLGGCNFRCGYCQNSDLVQRPDKITNIPEEDLLSLLFSRKKWLNGVCITGGEPTIHPELFNLCKKIKEQNYDIKLDTNGTNPDMIKLLLANGLIDYIAMDIKASIKNYKKVSRTEIIEDKIKESILLIMNSKIDYEFRTTIIPDIITHDEIKQISLMIKGAKKFYIQQFRSDSKAIKKKYRDMKSLKVDTLKQYKKIAEKHISYVQIRGA